MPKLATVTCVVVILVSIGAAANTCREIDGFSLTPYGPIQNAAYTDTHSAHVTLTNTTFATRFECFQGIVKRVDGKGDKVKSATVCSGDLNPHTTIVLEAPYDPGEVEKICDSSTTGNLDWDLCTFELRPVAF